MNKELARTLTAALAQFIDANRKEGAMCMSSYECELMEQTFMCGDFDQIEIYLKKKLNLDLTVDAPKGLDEAASASAEKEYPYKSECGDWYDEERVNDARDYHQIGFKAGAEWQKEQMLKEAIDGEICGDIRSQEEEPFQIWVKSAFLPLDGEFKLYDKVKLIIVKGD